MLSRSSLTQTLLPRPVALPPRPLLHPSPSFTCTRTFSLWPSSSTPPSPTPPSPDVVPPLPVKPVKPVLTDLFSPAALPPPTFFEPFSQLFLSLPPTLSLSYAAFIPLFTLFYRSTTTLPITLWQRSRTRKFADVVMPLVKKEQGRIALETRDECRRAGKTYDEYQKVFAKRAKEAAYALARKHNCSPRLTLILPPLFHIPIFVTATLVLRDACARAVSAMSISPANLPALLSASSSSDSETPSTLTLEALSHLHDLAASPVLWCPSAVLPDPTMYLPLLVGLAALLNVEITAHTRRAAADAAEALANPGMPTPGGARGASVPGGGGASGGVVASRAVNEPLSAAAKRRAVAQRTRDGIVVHARQLSSTSVVSATVPSSASSGGARTLSADVGAGVKGNSQRIITNMMRVAAVAFIPLAGMAPSAVCIYWVTSNLFTLVQNLAFFIIDRRREEAKRMGDILSGRAAMKAVIRVRR